MRYVLCEDNIEDVWTIPASQENSGLTGKLEYQLKHGDNDRLMQQVYPESVPSEKCKPAKACHRHSFVGAGSCEILPEGRAREEKKQIGYQREIVTAHKSE